MPKSEPVTILIVSEQADDIKLATVSLRGFFPESRVDSVYSSGEALQWAGRADWHLMLIDERLGLHGHPPLVAELKQRLPSTAFVLQTETSDSTTAVHALQSGADFLLHKHSPAFLTELVLYTKDAASRRSSTANCCWPQPAKGNHLADPPFRVYTHLISPRLFPSYAPHGSAARHAA